MGITIQKSGLALYPENCCPFSSKCLRMFDTIPFFVIA